MDLLELNRKSNEDAVRNINAGKPTIEQIAVRGVQASTFYQLLKMLEMMPELVETILTQEAQRVERQDRSTAEKQKPAERP